MSTAHPDRKVVCVNRKARHDYDLVDSFEAGLVLTGPEVKALREGKGNLVDAYVMIRQERPQLLNFEISAYTFDQTGTANPRRTRGLLLHRNEIRKLIARTREKGLTLVPLQVYFRGPWAKVEVALGRGRRKADKRQALRAKADRRQTDRDLQRRR